MSDTRLSNLFSLGFLASIIVASPASADSLAQFAAGVRLEHPSSTTTIIIDETMLKKNRSAGRITSCNQAIAPAPAAALESNVPDVSKRRAYWIRLHRQQVERITTARRKLADFDTKISDLDAKEFNAGNSGRAQASLRARLETMRAKRQTQAEILSREEAKLRSIIRQARSEGAQPGWFRE